MDGDGCNFNRPIFLMTSIFDSDTIRQFDNRITQINNDSERLWGQMSPDQMLAHCCVPYEYIFDERKDAPPLFMRWMLRLFFKKAMVNEVPYRPNTPSAPMFIKKDRYDLEEQKKRLIRYLERVAELGPSHFEGKKQISLGKLSAEEWNGLLYKHLDHHLRQFGV
jgi:Protein of unknown function (DUF1569)